MAQVDLYVRFGEIHVSINDSWEPNDDFTIELFGIWNGMDWASEPKIADQGEFHVSRGVTSFLTDPVTFTSDELPPDGALIARGVLLNRGDMTLVSSYFHTPIRVPIGTYLTVDSLHFMFEET